MKVKLLKIDRTLYFHSNWISIIEQAINKYMQKENRYGFFSAMDKHTYPDSTISFFVNSLSINDTYDVYLIGDIYILNNHYGNLLTKYLNYDDELIKFNVELDVDYFSFNSKFPKFEIKSINAFLDHKKPEALKFLFEEFLTEKDFEI
jgi:hypothetical protein